MQDLGGDLLKQGVTVVREHSLLKTITGEERLFSSSMASFVRTVNLELSLGTGSSVSCGIEWSSGGGSVEELIFSSTDTDEFLHLEESDFEIGKGVSKKSCLPLSTVQLARHDTRGDGEISE